MKCELVLHDYNYGDNGLDIDFFNNNICLNIYIDKDITLEMQLNNRKALDDCIDALNEFISSKGHLTSKLKFISDNFDKIFDNVEFIRLSFDNYNDMDFIKSNPIVLSKKIVLSNKIDITDYDKVIKLVKDYNDIIDNIYVILSENRSYVSLKDCYKTVSILKKQVDDIKKLGLSPMENIMYVYDIVRSRMYVTEDENESYHKSRDLSEVILGDKIVCEGYANMFQAILKYLNIDSQKIYLDDINNVQGGHVRNVIYVKDSKYNIDGVYYFDATWDSKKKNEKNEYLYRYKYFAKNEIFTNKDNKVGLKDNYSSNYLKEIYDDVVRIIKSGNYNELKKYYEAINYYSKIVMNDSLINPINLFILGQFDSNELLNKFKLIFGKFNKEIPAEVMLKVFNNVRKIEYYQNPDLFPYSLEDIYKTCLLSKWNFESDHLDVVGKFLSVVYDDDFNISLIDNFKTYGHESGLFKDAEQVRLTKVLRKIYDKKQN